ncbi:MAG: chorismate mutase [Treponema sp.]
MFSLIKRLRALRGAISTTNNASQIKEDVLLLYTSIIEKNKIKEKDIVLVQFSLTKDITKYNPATALRESGYLLNTALFVSQEAKIEESLPYIIRVLILYYGRKKPIYVYEKNAALLRKLTTEKIFF